MQLLTNSFVTIIEAYLILFAIVSMYALSKIVLKENITKDMRIREKFWAYQKKAGKWFLISFLGFLALGIIGQLVSGSFQKFLTTG